MNKKKLLKKLEEFYNIGEVKEGFSSQQACLEWCNKVAPLLKFNKQYYYTFLQNSHKMNLPLSSYTLGPAFKVMISQVQMAIEELKIELENEFSDYEAEDICSGNKKGDFMNPIERNAIYLLKLMVDNANEHYDKKWLVKQSQLNIRDINDVIEYLEDIGAIEVIREMGNPYFLCVILQAKGKYLYHELREKQQKMSATSKDVSLPLRPLLPIGSPYGFSEEDWKIVSTKKEDAQTLYVVLGMKCESMHYETKKLKKNLQLHFQNAIQKLNENNKYKISLNFISLAAGYGEHLFNKIARDIIGSDIAIFETSDLNPNVMLEIGIALTWGCRVFPIKKFGCKEPPSDISGQTWIDHDDSANKMHDDHFEEKLIEMIKTCMNEKIGGSP